MAQQLSQPDAGATALDPQRPIVVFGDDWGRHVSTMQHLFRHIAPTHPVVWVNGIGHRVPRLTARDLARMAQKVRAMVRSGGSGDSGDVEVGAPPRAIIHPRVLPWHLARPVRAFNRWSLVRAITRELGRAGLVERPLVVTGSPPSVAVLGRMGEIATVYLCMDDFLHLPGVSPEMLGPLEQELLARVDAVVATARALVESKRPRNGAAYYLPQGVNYGHFAAPRGEPADMAALPRPRVGFAGGLAAPVDLPLVRRLAEAFPSGSVVLVGPVTLADLSAIAVPNVYILGPRPYRELPAYVQAFDVGIIPYVLNEHTVAVDPLKLLEYLAAGIPVVTTALPEVRKYEHAVAVAATHDSFIAATRAALGPAGQERAGRQAVARQHGWDSRAAELLRILAQVVAEKGVTARV